MPNTAARNSVTGEEHQHDADDQYAGRPSRLLPRLEADWLAAILHSIGDAVIATNADGLVTFMNPVAESLTGWNAKEASGQPLETVFEIVNEETRHDVENPLHRAVRERVLANHTLLIAKDGTERPINDCAAPIRDDQGQVAGAVLVFRDITERRQAERKKLAALDYAENIIATLRHPFMVLDNDLRVKSANRSFYDNFKVSPDETEGQRVYDLGNAQWNIPRLRTLLEEILPQNSSFEEFEVEHDFPTIGRCNMLLNARRIHRGDAHADLILLGIEDVTKRRQLEKERLERSLEAVMITVVRQ